MCVCVWGGGGGGGVGGYLFCSVRSSIVEQLLSISALLGYVEDVDVILGQCHFFHPVSWPSTVHLW